MSTITKVTAPLFFVATLAACVGGPDSSVGTAATGAALGATTGLILGGSRTDIAAGAAIGAIAGAAVPTQ